MRRMLLLSKKGLRLRSGLRLLTHGRLLLEMVDVFRELGALDCADQEVLGILKFSSRERVAALCFLSFVPALADKSSYPCGDT